MDAKATEEFYIQHVGNKSAIHTYYMAWFKCSITYYIRQVEVHATLEGLSTIFGWI